ncbi:MAG TPA: hypothetical protein VJ806_05555 [Luteimonas sp.]|nr:hypothetical protein [Luteimonas sp.]
MRALSKSRCFAIAVSASAMLCALTVNAQSSYDKSIKSANSVGALDNNVFGDSINYYSGQLSFNVTDLSIPGNSALDMSVARSYSAEFERLRGAKPDPAHPLRQYVFETRKYLFGDWDLEIPHIAGTFAEGIGWQNDSATPLARCSVIGQVRADGTPSYGEPKKLDPKFPRGFWSGDNLHAGGSTRSLIVATEAAIPKPTTGGPYHWTTKDDWWISCIAAANTAGEGFLAIDPAGTKYTFAWMSARNVGVISEIVDLGNEKYQQFNTYLQEVMFLPTRIEDRFGNYVEYAYSADEFARPLSITSRSAANGDVRTLTFAYNASNLIESVTDGARTVRYAYAQTSSGPSLSTVTFDDLSTWNYQLTGMVNMQSLSLYNPEDLCAQLPPPMGGQPPISSYDCVGYPEITGGGTGTVKHPSGAQATYVLQTHFHLTDTTGYAVGYPLSVKEKTVSGPGLPARKWSYAFAPNKQSVQTQCRAGACPTRIWTDEIGPDYRVTRRMFGVQPQDDQGLLLQQLEGYYPVSTTMVSSPTVRLTRMDRINGTDPEIASDPSPVTTVAESPVFVKGTNFFYRKGQLLGTPPGGFTAGTKWLFTNLRHLPISQRVVQLDGRTFNYSVNSWDNFDRPIQTTRSSTAP